MKAEHLHEKGRSGGNLHMLVVSVWYLHISATWAYITSMQRPQAGRGRAPADILATHHGLRAVVQHGNIGIILERLHWPCKHTSQNT
jgi:hypothetical protein